MNLKVSNVFNSMSEMMIKIDDESDSDSDYGMNEIEHIQCQLLHAYLEGKKHLYNILGGLPNTLQERIRKQIGENFMDDRHTKLQQNRLEEFLSGEKTMGMTNKQKRRYRMKTTDKIVQKRKQRFQEDKMLQERYNRQEIKAMFRSSEGFQQNTEPYYQPHQLLVSHPQQQRTTTHIDAYHPGLTFNHPSPKQLSKNSSARQSHYQIQVRDQTQKIQQKQPQEPIIIERQQAKQIYDIKMGQYDKIDSQDSFLYASEHHHNNLAVNVNIAKNHDNETSSEVNFNSRFGQAKNKQFDTYSQRSPNPSMFILLEKEKLEKQRQIAQQLKKQVSQTLANKTTEADLPQAKTSQRKNQLSYSQISEIEKNNKHNRDLSQIGNLLIPKLGNTRIEDSEMKESMASRKSLTSNGISNIEMQDHFLTNTRYMLGELCQLFSMTEIYKFLLNNKQYQILTKLSSNISVNKIQSSSLQKGITKVLQSQLKQWEIKKTEYILKAIFKNKKQISYEQFCKIFTPKIYENQFLYLSDRKSKIKVSKTMDVVGKLLSLWLEMQYFESNLKEGLNQNTSYIRTLTEKFESASKAGVIGLEEVENFVYGTTNNRINHKKVELYFSETFHNLQLEIFKNWSKQNKSVKGNQRRY